MTKNELFWVGVASGLRKNAAWNPVHSDQVLRMDGPGPVLADYLGNLPFGSRRAGRAQALAEASGTPTKQIPFRVRYPQTALLLESLGGGAVGGVAGAGALGLVDLASGNRMEGVAGGGVMGGLVGSVAGLVGSVAGAVNSIRIRRNQMDEIKAKFDATRELSPRNGKPSLAKNVFLPYGSPHRTGRDQTHAALRSGQPYQPGGGRNTYDTASLLGLPLGALMHGAGGFHSSLKLREAQKQEQIAQELAMRQGVPA